MTLDEAIEFSKEQSEIFRGEMGEFLDNCTEWLKDLKVSRNTTRALEKCRIYSILDKQKLCNEIVEELEKVKGNACDGNLCKEDCEYDEYCEHGEFSQYLAIDSAIEIVKNCCMNK